jgi:hypothetical protein
MKKRVLGLGRFSVVVAACALVACGGGGGGRVSSVTYAGKVVDGAIAGATVCIDLNSNLSCDPGEPSTVSAADGSYSLQYQGGNPVGLPILAVVPVTARDSDDNGKTLAEVGKSPFNLATPIGSAAGGSAIPVTPLTTLVTHQLLGDATNSKRDSQSIAVANQQVQRILGTDKDLLAIAPTKTNEVDLHKVSQVVAVVLGDMTRQAGNTSKMAQVQAGTALLQDVLPQIVTAGKVDPNVAVALNSIERTQVVSNLKSSLESTVGYSTVVTGVVANIALNTKLPEQETPSAQDVLMEGFVSLEPKRFNPDTGLPFPNDLGNYTEQKFLRSEYLQYVADTRQVKELERHWYQSSWAKGAEWGVDHGLTTAGTWVPDDGLVQVGGSFKLNGNCVELPHAKGIDNKQTACFTRVPLSGRKISDFFPRLCEDARAWGVSPGVGCANQVFAQGSHGLNLTVTALKDYYAVNVPQRISATNRSENYYCGQTVNSVPELVDLMLSRQASGDCRIYLWNSFSVQLKSYDAASARGTLQWAYWNGREYVTQESGTFKVVTAHNNTMLVIPPSQGYHRENPGDLTGRDFIVACALGGMYSGTVTYANTRQAMTFGTAMHGNPKMMDSILSAIGISQKFPYEQSITNVLGN